MKGTYYKDRRAGCFQTFVTVPSHTVCLIPPRLTYENAACLGVAGLTAAMTLWKWLGVPMPSELGPNIDSGPRYLLIWGGSTITAQFAIQIANKSGIRVVAVTSAKTQSLVSSLGAWLVIPRDGKSNDEIVGEIRAATGEGITLAVDLVGSHTAAACLAAVSTTRHVEFAPLAMMDKETIVPANVTVQNVEMKRFVLDKSSARYSRELDRLIQEDAVQLPAITVLDGGLEKVQQGLELLKAGDMGGKKLVVRM